MLKINDSGTGICDVIVGMEPELSGQMILLVKEWKVMYINNQ